MARVNQPDQPMLDLFPVPSPAPELPGQMDYSTQVASLVSEVLKAAVMDRFDIAARMCRLTGKDVSKHMLDAYASDPASGQPQAAMTLHAPDRVDEIGKITADLTLPWLRTMRDALSVGTAHLAQRARGQWKISNTIDYSLNATDWQPGDTITLNHPWLPIGQATITDLAEDADQQRLGMTLIMPAGEPPRIEIQTRSALIAPTAANPLKIAYTNGTATFTISDDTGSPIAGAAVTLDSQTTHQTDRTGQVQFKTSRGQHTLSINATGYAPFQITVNV